MTDYIYNPSSVFTQKGKHQEEEEIELYTIKGMEEFIDKNNRARINKDNDKVLAKRTIRKNGSIKYSIRLGNNGKFYNPVSIYGEEKSNTFLDRICRSNDRFKEVGSKVFELYIEFLNTKNTALLINAERENE